MGLLRVDIGFAFLALTLGLAIGSFLNVVIHRLPRMLERDWRQSCRELAGDAPDAQPRYDLVLPHSSCPACGHRIPWYENIPVLSYIALKGRCSACSAPIHWRYPLVECLTGALFLAALWHFGLGAQAAAAAVLLAALLALAFIDFDTHLLPDDLTMPLLWLGLVVNLQSLFVPLEEAVIGAVAGYLALWSVYWLFKLATGKEGMGYGDFKLLAALGAWLGWKMLLPVVLVSSISGAAIGLGLIVFGGHDRAKPIPYGPYLILAGGICLFWGQALIRFYLPN